MKFLSILTITALTCWFRLSAANLNSCHTMNEAAESVSANILTVKLNERQLKNYWSKVDKNGPLPDQSIEKYKGLNQCWMWTASKIRNGYGQFMLNFRMMKAHRVAYLIHHGTLDLSLCTCHSCDQPSCCNPEHLWQGTHKDNSADRVAKGRSATGDRSGARLYPERLSRGKAHWAHKHPEKCRRGDNHPYRLNPLLHAHGDRNAATKLTQEKVQEIRSLKGLKSQQAIADTFGVSQTLVSAILRREIWAHI